jgi:uncharacterized protein (DUF58 family)
MDVAEARGIADEALAGLSPDGGDAVRLDDDGVCRLVFENGGNMYFILDAASAALVVWLPAGILPAEPAQAATVLRQLMQANLFWGGTNGATLSLAADGETVILQRRVPLYGLDGEELAFFVEQMLEDATNFNQGLALSAELPDGTTEVQVERPNLSGAIRG